MTTRIVWRYRRKRHTPSAAKSRKQDQSITVDSQAAGGQHSHGPEELKQAKVQFAEEEEAQTKLQFQEEEEAQTKVQFQEEEEEEMQTRVQFQEEEEEAAQAKTQREPVPARSCRLIRSVARSGFKGSPGSLPFARRIQNSFGRYNISGVKAFSDLSAKKANLRLGSLAYASREKVAFRGYPDLQTAAHEAAHIIQQRKGVQLKDGAGRKGDAYERHADEVADRVTRGKSAESLLGKIPHHDKASKG